MVLVLARCMDTRSDSFTEGCMMCSLGPFTPQPEWRRKLVDENKVRGKFVLEVREVKALLEENGMDMDTLLQALVAPAATLALPYLSGFFVG